jgi:hypothetical protein
MPIGTVALDSAPNLRFANSALALAFTVRANS